MGSHLPVVDEPNWLVQPISLARSLNWPSDVCSLPRWLLLHTVIPNSGRYPAVVFLVSKCCIPLQSGNQARSISRYLFPR